MRCRNCHTVMMDDDPICPSCHATAESATSGPPDLAGEKPNGLLLLLPMFGGALGGLAYAALTSGHASASSGSRGGGGGFGPIKKIVGGVLLVLGALFLLLAFLQFNNVQKIVQQTSTPATPAELRTRSYVDKPPPWVSYTFEESKPVDETVTRKRQGYGGEVHAKVIMVRVENRWLVATVAPDFEGNELVGRLLPIDSPISQPLIERQRKLQSDPKEILPYEFFAVEGCASDQQLRYHAAGLTGVIGLFGLLLGVWLCFLGRC